MFSNVFPENFAGCWIMWKNMVDLDRPQMTIRHMRIACWITKAADPRSEYVILIDFSLHHWLHERASLLRYTYIVCLITT